MKIVPYYNPKLKKTVLILFTQAGIFATLAEDVLAELAGKETTQPQPDTPNDTKRHQKEANNELY